jgi:hypothetical protein
VLFLVLAGYTLGLLRPGVSVFDWPAPERQAAGPARVQGFSLAWTGLTSVANDVSPARPWISQAVSGSLLTAGTLAGGVAVEERPPRSVVAPSAPQGRVLDVRYVDQVYAQRRPECSSSRACFWNDCGPAAGAMVLHYEGLESRDVLTNRQATLDLVCETKPGCRGTTDRDRMLATLARHGLDVYLIEVPSLELIADSIDRGHPVILSLNPHPDHMLVAVGYKPGGILVVHDPYGGAFWWDHPQRSNLPFTGSPKRNGEGVAYNYTDLQPVLIYGLFVAGAPPVPARLLTMPRWQVARGGAVAE